MKTTIRHGAMIKCDIVTVSDDGCMHTDRCDAKFLTYSVSHLVREQAANAGWTRTRVGYVMWPGEPPMANAKKVDICPAHKALVLTAEEAKVLREKRKDEKKAARAAARAAAKAEKKRLRDEARAAKKQENVHA